MTPEERDALTAIAADMRRESDREHDLADACPMGGWGRDEARGRAMALGHYARRLEDALGLTRGPVRNEVPGGVVRGTEEA